MILSNFYIINNHWLCSWKCLYTEKFDYSTLVILLVSRRKKKLLNAMDSHMAVSTHYSHYSATVIKADTDKNETNTIKLEPESHYDDYDIIKNEYNIEQWGQHNQTADVAEPVKMEELVQIQDKLEDEIKSETEKESIKTEYMDTIELTEELDIKPDGTSDAEVDSIMNQKVWEKRLGVVHQEAEKNLFLCHSCNYASSCKEDIISHILVGHCNLELQKTYTSNGFICKKCSKVFRRKENLDDHILKKHPELSDTISRKIHRCPNCSYKTTVKSFLDEHKTIHSGETRSCKIFECAQCDAKFKRKLAVDEHVLRKHPDFITSVSSKMYVCPNCPYVTTRKDVLDKHIFHHPQATVGHNCMHCNVTFRTKLAVDDHIVKNHPGLLTSVTSKIHECSNCPYKTTIKNNIDVHMMTLHPDTASSLFSMCVHCSASFQNRRTLDEHIIRKHPDFFCTYKTVRKGDLDKHISVHPDMVSKYELSTCFNCNVGFKSKQVLDAHIIRKHPSHMASVTSKIHRCSDCTYITTMKNNLDRHTMAVHPSAAADLVVRCAHCTVTFKNRLALDDHIVRKHPDETASVTRKIYQCPTCSYKTVRKSDIGRHIMLHSGAVPDKMKS